MSKPFEWSDLPNAAHIDRLLSDSRSRPDVWGAAFDAAVALVTLPVRDAAWSEAWNRNRDMGRSHARTAAWDYARGLSLRAPTTEVAVGSVGVADPLLALGVWDDAGEMIDLPVDAMKLLAASGSAPAALLMPAVLVLTDEWRAYQHLTPWVWKV